MMVIVILVEAGAGAAVVVETVGKVSNGCGDGGGQPMKPYSSSSSSSSSKRWMHDVFLSFRSDDTCKGFTGHLYVTMEEAGINVFIDNQLRRGEEITAELEQAIQGSRIPIIVFSMRYADSSWCLEELETDWYFAQAFQKHEELFQKDTDHKVVSWRATLTEASNLSGWDLRNALDRHEAKFIRKIIKDITILLNTS
ncbi:PREDICTED: TMV resistance N [Prunus dulcis]|uniref:PREDICTED: TMV resistance N n=1 Tax=Prunus dulcis TaxID=3755 RepID=A0A5E4EKV6_PRUDU|nr:PREDICTED: TMV resistance N [Prunus dulcis]